MKSGLLGLILLFTLNAQAKDFQGAVPRPIDKVSDAFSQLQVRFPSMINKAKNSQKEVFKVSCSPAVEGYSSWADNDTLWTYNIKAKDEYSSTRVVGGTKCDVTQTETITANDGTVWNAGTINYSVTLTGPNVTDVYAAEGFKGTLREKEPVVMLVFDGPVDRTRFFAEQNGYLNYMSANAPSEKIPLMAVPQDQSEKVFSYFKTGRYFDIDYKDQNWILATVQQALIPGAQVALNIQNQSSSANANVHSEKKFTREFSVRSQFEAQIQCANPSAKTATCLPRSPISVLMNGRTKWTDIKQAYIEYIPYKSTDHKVVRSYPELNQEVSLWESFLNALSDYFPFLAKYNDTIVDSIVFNVNIEPETQAKVVLPAGLTDIDGRLLSNAIAEFNIRIGTMGEIIHVPQAVSFFEKNVPNLYLPVGIVNLNQKISIRKTGTNPKVWEPVRDIPTMINLIRAYEKRGTYRDTPTYASPLDSLGLKNTVVDQQLTGAKNRPNFLQFPFAAPGVTPASGFYAIEISSPTFESGRSNVDDNQYYNPKYVLAQVTDLAVHLKKGKNSTVAWVTRLSGGVPVAGADVEIYNCLGHQMKVVKTDASGLATLPNQAWASDCKGSGDVYSPYYEANSFYAVAKSGDDMALTHSSWSSPNSNALSAPGVEWFYGDLTEGEVHFHSVIGVNLVKPGQDVPIELVAKIPQARGFSEVPANQLPTTARINSADDEDVYYELPLTWKNGMADIVWHVPSDSSVNLGRYFITLSGFADGHVTSVDTGEIEVAEFKVPLMTGILSFPNQDLVKPNSIPVSTVIRYANGVGAGNLKTDLSYYFEPTYIYNKTYGEFTFGNGTVKLSEDESSGTNQALPKSTRPSTIQGLVTAKDGSITKDLAQETAVNGKTIAEVLKTMDHPQKLVVRVRYQDQMGEYQTLSQAKDIYNASEYVGTHLVSGARNEARLQAVVMDVHKKNITSAQSLDIKIIRVETKIIGEELYGGLIKNTLERELKPVRWVKDCATDKQVVNCRVGALQAGNYAFQVISKNSKQAGYTLFKIATDGRVYGERDYYNFGDDEGNKQLPLALNKKSYKDGEKAVVSFAAPFKTCRALVTIERSDVMDAQVVPNACEKGFVELPVNANLAPNAFVSVYAVTGRAATASAKPGEMDLGRPTYRLGFANMKVNWGRYKSKVTVKTNKEKYKPGEMVDVQVTVKPEEGSLAGGTVTLVAIEEKILELKSNTTYKILDALMQLRGHGVDTISPLEKVETVTSNTNPDIPSDDSRKGGDEGGDGGSSKSDFKRKLFNALVAFQPGVPVVNGMAKFSFKANDSLTRFKIFAIANDTAEKFGTGEAVYLTEQDTQIYSNIPTVAHSGDSYPVKVTIQNNSSKTGKYKTVVEVTVTDANGHVVSRKTLTKQTEIKPSASQSVDVGDVSVDDEASRVQYVVRVFDENGNVVDSMEPEAQVVLPSVPLAIHNSYIVQLENGALTQELTKEATALPNKGEIHVSLASSLVNTAVRQIQQRMAQDPFADFFILSQFNKALLNSTASNPAEIKTVLESLLGYVDSNGFIKFYPQANRGNLWLTASILNSLQQEPWAVKLLPAALEAKFKAALGAVLDKSVDPKYVGKSPMDWVRAQTMMGRGAFAFNDQNLQAKAKALSTKIAQDLLGNPAVYGPTVEQWTNSDLVNVWLLDAYANPATALTSPVYAQLTAPSRLVYTGNKAALAGKPSFGLFYSDETSESADLLAGHARLHGDKKLARALAVGLVNANTNGWYNNSTMMSVAQGLKVFGHIYEDQVVTGTTAVTVPEENVHATADWSKSSTAEMKSPWLKSKATVQVTHNGQGSPWVGIQGLTAVPLTVARGQGLSIEKEIRNVTREIGYQAGDIVEVTLHIHANNAVSNVALQDPIPAGSNIISDAYGDYSTGQKSYSGYKFLFEILGIGESTVKYQYQLNNPGTFKLPPTHVEALYTPSIFAESPNAAMTVQ